MKKVYPTLILLILGLTSFTQTYQLYTAKNGGYWSDPANWEITVRLDGEQKNKVVIPIGINMIATNDVNLIGLGDVDLVIAGKITMHQNTSIILGQGSTILLNNGSISGSKSNQQIIIGSVVKYQGNFDDFSEEFLYADQTTGSSPNGFIPFTIMPVKFSSFIAKKIADRIQLTWSTENETNNSHFEIERSLDGRDFKKIGIVSGTSSSSISNSYSFVDNQVKSKMYYRIRQVDLNGNAMYSSVRTVNTNEQVETMRIFASSKNVIIDLNTDVTTNLRVSVLNSNGQLIAEKIYSKPSYRMTVPVETATGAYIVRVCDNNGNSVVKKVML